MTSKKRISDKDPEKKKRPAKRKRTSVGVSISFLLHLILAVFFTQVLWHDLQGPGNSTYTVKISDQEEAATQSDALDFPESEMDLTLLEDISDTLDPLTETSQAEMFNPAMPLSIAVPHAKTPKAKYAFASQTSGSLRMSSGGGGAGHTVRLFGASVGTVEGAGSVVFLLDASISMFDAWSIVQEKLTDAVKDLPESVQFNLVVFSDSAKQYSRSMIPANRTNKTKVSKYIQSCNPDGMTNYYEAFSKALRMRPGVIIFIADGSPTVGRIVDTDKLLAWVRRANKGKTKINTLAINMYSGDTGMILMQKLATQNRGHFSKVKIR